MPFKLSVSSADTWQSCPRKYFYKYVERREPIEQPIELKFGSAWHSLRDGAGNTHGLTGIDLVKLNVLNAAYERHYANDPLEVIAHEEEFELPSFDGNRLDPDIVVCGRIDARRNDCLVEFKTTSSYIDAGSMYWERILDDRQIQTYLGAMWSEGHTYNDVLYDVARKPMIKRRSKETLEEFELRLAATIAAEPEAYFQRRMFTFTSEQVADTWRDLHSIAYQIPDCSGGKALYPKNPKSCHAYGRPCEFLDVCRGVTTVSDNGRFKDRKPS